MNRSQFIQRVTAAALVSGLASCRSMLPDCTRPVRTLSYAPKAGGAAEELVVLLPGRFSQPEEFEREGIVDLVRSKKPRARVISPDLHLGYYVDRIPHTCLHEEIVHPARKRGERVTLMGVSLGGLGSLIYTLRYPRDVGEVLMLAPFVGEDDLVDEIEAAGGIEHWHPGEIMPRNQEEGIKKLWAEMKAKWHADGPPVPMKIITGREDRHLQANRFFARSFLKQHQLAEIAGGHEWTCWKQGAELLLA